MEIAIALFLGFWLSGASLLAYRRLKGEFKEVIDNKEGEEVQK